MLTRYQTEFDLYIRLELSGALTCPPAWLGEKHRHAFREILYAVSGECDISIGDETRHLSPDQALIVPPMEEHRLSAGPLGTVITYVGFRCETEDGLAAGNTPTDHYLTDNEDLKQIMREMALSTDFRPFAERIIRALVPVAASLRGPDNGRDDGAGSQKSILCRKTVKYIRSNPQRFVTVEEIAASLYVTPHYLGLVFSSTMGQTILKYQQGVKMERAAALIRGGMALNEVSGRLGYSSPQYFSKCFKAYYGFPPVRMRSGAERL